MTARRVNASRAATDGGRDRTTPRDGEADARADEREGEETGRSDGRDGQATGRDDGRDGQATGRVSDWTGEAPRMRDVTHVHDDHDPRAWHWFSRGPVVAADGGERGPEPSTDDAGTDARPGASSARDVEDEQLRDVSHVPPHGDGANQVWDRGEEDDAP